jgi:ATP-binding protein involved in chromosome partitioning
MQELISKMKISLPTEIFSKYSLLGGVGKSSISVNLALSLSRLSHRVGILDADVFGPSIPTLLNLRNHKATTVTKTNLIEPLINFNLKCMSMSFLTKSDGPVVWRGLMVMQAIERLLRQVAWSPLDYLIIDLPPGTGDIQLSIAQLIPLSGVVMVTTPQELSLIDVRKAIEMFRLVHVPIIGIVENFSTYFCQKCGHEEKIFGENGGQLLAKEFQLNILQSLPIDTQFRQRCDQGRPIIQDNDSVLSSKFNNLANQIIEQIETNKKTSIG